MGLELQQKKDVLEVERNNIIALAREVISFSEEITSLDGEIISLNGEPYSVEMISHIIDKWKSLNDEPIKWIDNKKAKIDKKTAEINSKNAEIYKRLEEMIEKYRQEEAEIVKLEQEENRPDYIKKLIKIGLLFEDGKRVITDLDDIAYYFKNTYKKDFPEGQLVVSERFLSENFEKSQGGRYGIGSVKTALAIYNDNGNPLNKK
ncbi:MAG: hypothetical protein LBI03_05465 [Clostridiales bacterium]|jgi:hypothetical protein|nr:hypothetical protein [Clostridiales bacterium]